METIENLFKHKIFFTKQEVFHNYTGMGTIKWSTLYKSNIKYSSDEIDITNNEELFDNIKPFLYYLGSKDLECEEGEEDYDEYITTFTVGAQFKFLHNIEEECCYIKLFTLSMNYDLDLYNIRPCPVNPTELETNFLNPFEIHIDFEKEYSLIDREYDEEYSDPPDDSEDETADEPEEKEPAPICKPFNSD